MDDFRFTSKAWDPLPGLRSKYILPAHVRGLGYQFETQTTPKVAFGCLQSKIIWLFTYRFFPRNFLENKNTHPLVNPGNMVFSLPIGQGPLEASLCRTLARLFRARSNLAPVLMPFVRGELGDFHLSLPPKICVLFRDHCVELRFYWKMGVNQSISGSLAKNMLIFWMLYSVCSESLPIRKFSESFMEELILQ